MPDQSVAAPIGGAAVRGLVCYVVCYLLYVHYNVVHDWSTFDASNYTREVEVNVDLPEQSVFGLADEMPSLNAIDELVHDIKTLPQQKKPEKVGRVLDEYQATLSQWKDNDDGYVSSDLLLRDGSESIERLKLSNLLQQSSLSNLSLEELNSLLKFSLADLQRLVDDKRQVKWSTVKNILSPETAFPKKDKLSVDDLFDMVCQSDVSIKLEAINHDDTAVSTDDMNDEELAKVQALYAQEEDLESYISSVESLLKSRTTEPQKKCQEFPNVSDSLSGATKTLDDVLHRRTAVLKETALEENKATEVFLEEQEDGEEDDDGTSCEGATTGGNVGDLLDAGLNALARHQDMRAALLGVLKDVDPDSAENLILDADFRMEAPLPKASSRENFRLRHVVDSPLLSNMATPVDWFLDIISGYYDPLDHWIDQITERLVDHSDKNLSSLGRVFVTNIWYWSGQLAVPLPKQIREFLWKHPRGRAFLESIS